MKKLNSLAFKMPLSISCISSIIIIILLVISLFFSSKGITESINVGFRNTVEGYAYLLDALTEAQMLLANSYASDANIRNYMIFRDDVYSVYSGRDMTNFIEKNSYAESIYLTDINGNIIEQKIKRKSDLVKSVIEEKFSTNDEISLNELKFSDCIDKEEQNIIKDYIDDLVFALYFNIDIKELGLSNSEKIKKLCQKNNFYSYIYN